MELYEEIIINIIKNKQIIINADRIVEMECYKSMQKIKTIIEDDSLNDEECFIKIEEIVRVFEKLGSNAGDRHDF